MWRLRGRRPGTAPCLAQLNAHLRNLHRSLQIHLCNCCRLAPSHIPFASRVLPAWGSPARRDETEREHTASKRMCDLERTTQANYASHHKKLQVQPFG